jgi:hypothetical protein
MDLLLQKHGDAATQKQIFYLTDKKPSQEDQNPKEGRAQSQKYTLKKAYNLLAGRPVFDHLNESWHKINFKKALSNGNYEIKRYSKNYGFDLETVLSYFAIKDVLTEMFKQSLIASLERGNLQKAVFVAKDGREESFYITPNLTRRSLDVYDENKQPIPIERLAEREYISKELYEKLSVSSDAPKQVISQTGHDGELKVPGLPIVHEPDRPDLKGADLKIKGVEITRDPERPGLRVELSKEKLQKEIPRQRKRQRIK